ncbi:MAG TPA: imidazole glycerol phosphate synthase subunit HisH [Solirubrobacteraceae bacterium]|nr:imidazole glycerol phosphate synthase subunit HisH [Solirubrobacteraceae bacterium]
MDYGMGNRRSVQKALETTGARATITRDLEVIAGAAGLVVPGVGAFPQAMRNLAELGLDTAVRAYAERGRPLLGICLGMQLLFDGSEEFDRTAGLGLIPGRVTPLQAPGLRLPHIGWNLVRLERPSPLTAALEGEARPFYHVHSLAVRPDQADHVVGTTQYGERFASIVQRDQIYGVQFHPEKSSRDGLRMLAAFTALCGTPAGGAIAVSQGTRP